MHCVVPRSPPACARTDQKQQPLRKPGVSYSSAKFKEQKNGQEGGKRILAGILAGCVVFSPVLNVPPSFARIPTDALLTLENVPRPPGPEELLGATRKRPAKGVRNAQEDVQSEVREIISITKEAKEASQQGDYTKALELYTLVVDKFPDLAVTEYSRLNRALLLYETGRPSQAILELDDEEVALRGNPEVHSALAVVLYVEKPNQISRAEDQWDLAMSLDRRYADPEWVEKEKNWPPRVVRALQRFLTLQ